jgi:hypothetical protein
VATLTLLIVLATCAKPEIDLGNGYRFIKTDSVNGSIVDRQNVNVAEPNVVRFEVVGNFVVGERKESDLDFPFSRQFGYFYLNRATGEYKEGMSKAELDGFLKKHHLASRLTDR